MGIAAKREEERRQYADVEDEDEEFGGRGSRSRAAAGERGKLVAVAGERKREKWESERDRMDKGQHAGRK